MTDHPHTDAKRLDMLRDRLDETRRRCQEAVDEGQRLLDESRIILERLCQDEQRIETTPGFH